MRRGGRTHQLRLTRSESHEEAGAAGRPDSDRVGGGLHAAAAHEEGSPPADMAPAAQVKAASALESLTTLLDVGGWVARGMGSVGGRSADTSGAQNKFAASRGGAGREDPCSVLARAREKRKAFERDAEQKAREKEAVGQGGLDLDQDCGCHSPRQDRLATSVGTGRPPGQKEADVLLALVR